MKKERMDVSRMLRIARRIAAAGGEKTYDPGTPAKEDPSELYVWKKGHVSVYRCMITDENLAVCAEFVRAFCKEESPVEAGRYVVYNPNISIAEGPVWTNKLKGYGKPDGAGEGRGVWSIGGSVSQSAANSYVKELEAEKADMEKAGNARGAGETGRRIELASRFSELVFEPVEFVPKDLGDGLDRLLGEGAEGSDYFVGFKMPKGMGLYAAKGYGTPGADGKVVADPGGDYWMAVQDGKFDYGRTVASMKQSNYVGYKASGAKVKPLSQKCLELWEKAKKAFEDDKDGYAEAVKSKRFPDGWEVSI